MPKAKPSTTKAPKIAAPPRKSAAKIIDACISYVLHVQGSLAAARVDASCDGDYSAKMLDASYKEACCALAIASRQPSRVEDIVAKARTVGTVLLDAGEMGLQKHHAKFLADFAHDADRLATDMLKLGIGLAQRDLEGGAK